MAIACNQLIGTWELISYQTEKNGETVYPLGADAKGLIMYNPDGYMSAQLQKVGRQPYASGHIHTGTTEEMAAAAHGYMAYSGRFEINAEEGTVIHHMDVSMNPTWEGQHQPRVGVIKDDVLEIYNGLHPEDKLRWRRVKPN